MGTDAQQRFSQLPDELKWGLIQLLDLENSQLGAQRRTAQETSLSEDYLVYYSDLLDVVSSLEDERSLNVLFTAMDSGYMATKALSSFGPVAFAGAVAKSLDSNPDIRHAAAMVMVQMISGNNASRMDDKRFAAEIRAELVRLSSDESPFVRVAAVRGLAQFKDRGVQSLLRRLSEIDPYESSEYEGDKRTFPVRNAAIEALISTSNGVVGRLKPAFNEVTPPPAKRNDFGETHSVRPLLNP